MQGNENGARATTAELPQPPPFDPDIELIDHLEGNARERRNYRREADELREKVRAERSRA